MPNGPRASLGESSPVLGGCLQRLKDSSEGLPLMVLGAQ